MFLICEHYKTCKEKICWNSSLGSEDCQGYNPFEYMFAKEDSRYFCSAGDAMCRLIPITMFQYLIWKKTSGDRDNE